MYNIYKTSWLQAEINCGFGKKSVYRQVLVRLVETMSYSSLMVPSRFNLAGASLGGLNIRVNKYFFTLGLYTLPFSCTSMIM